MINQSHYVKCHYWNFSYHALVKKKRIKVIEFYEIALKLQHELNLDAWLLYGRLLLIVFSLIKSRKLIL